VTLLAVRVAAKRQEAQDICSFELAPADAAVPLPAFAPGAHVDVHVPGGLIRQYSLWNHPSEEGVYRIGVLKEASGRGGSRAMHEAVEEGAVLHIGAPRNHFPLHGTDAPSLLLAGGIGITPILCMAQELAARHAKFELHYCTRSLARTAFVQKLRAAEFAPCVHFHHDDGPDDQRLEIPSLLASQARESHLYVCGPKGFMDAVLTHARATGWSEDRLHYEFFQADPAVLEGDQPFQVKLAKTGRVISISADKTVVQALAEAGIEVSTSCEQGICGTCVTRVIEGIPDHRDSFLMPEEHAANDCFTPCCSRARTTSLVLDL
jgi:vanillate monooxygenase ferredoxin subunit